MRVKRQLTCQSEGMSMLRGSLYLPGLTAILEICRVSAFEKVHRSATHKSLAKICAASAQIWLALTDSTSRPIKPVLCSSVLETREEMALWCPAGSAYYMACIDFQNLSCMLHR